MWCSLVPQSSQSSSISTNPRNHSKRKWGILFTLCNTYLASIEKLWNNWRNLRSWENQEHHPMPVRNHQFCEDAFLVSTVKFAKSWWVKDEWTTAELKDIHEVVSLADACAYNPWGHNPPDNAGKLSHAEMNSISTHRQMLPAEALRQIQSIKGPTPAQVASTCFLAQAHQSICNHINWIGLNMSC